MELAKCSTFMKKVKIVEFSCLVQIKSLLISAIQ